MRIRGDGGVGRRRVRTCAMVRGEFSVFSGQFSVGGDWRGMAGFNRGALGAAFGRNQRVQGSGLSDRVRGETWAGESSRGAKKSPVCNAETAEEIHD